ncbi:uncharacterized protein LOC106087739 [Stomoxys calcitrans]|uniref:Chitin-binding type-2 domain-containing protein n=1 Tax=Stomoxys calcitrans TaxID=35570 RepID=A0A1I8NXU8_STOCA|nr:uncharacterized protein LOC106087739 [Stomoxys calcitrans]
MAAIQGTFLLAIIAVVAATVLLQVQAQNLVQGCKYENELWPSDDGTKFYLCVGDDLALEQSCEPNTFFVKNSTVAGCVPLSEVDGNCIYHVGPPTCTGISLSQPQPHELPTNFYLCPVSGGEPLVMTCPDQKAFVNQDGYLGCFTWPSWREIRGCTNDE